MISPKEFPQFPKSELPKNYTSKIEKATFKDVDDHINKILNDTAKLRQYKISVQKYLPKDLFHTEITPVYCSDTLNGCITDCSVRIGYFTVGFSMIFVNKRASDKNMSPIHCSDERSIYSFKSPDGSECVTKRIKLHDKKCKGVGIKMLREHLSLKEIIKEFAIYKIADLFDIGPKIVNFGFDIVCYNDLAQFYMQKCENNIQNIDKKRLDFCVRTLHSLSFVHCDIKPQNLLISKSKGKNAVLTDFGLASAVKENIGQKTRTGRCGTQLYMGDEMKKIRKGEIGYIDLFDNDLQMIRNTLQANTNISYEEQLSTADTSSPLCSLIQYQVLQKIHNLYDMKKQLDFKSYEWFRFTTYLNEQQKKTLAEMFNCGKQQKIKQLIYCYGYSSKLLEEMEEVDQDIFQELKDIFNTKESRDHLMGDFHFKFDRYMKKAIQLKKSNKKQPELIQQQLTEFYQKLQFQIFNQFRTVNSTQTKRIDGLYEKMKALRILNQSDPVWDMAIEFVKGCVKDISDEERQSNFKQIFKILEYQAVSSERLVENLFDMLTLSYCSPSVVERVCVCSELVKLKDALPPIKLLYYKCFLMKLLQNKSSQEYQILSKQLSEELQKPIDEKQVSQSQRHILSECRAINFYQNNRYYQALQQYSSLKDHHIYECGMSKQISPILSSIADCYFQLKQYQSVIIIYRDIFKVTRIRTANDCERIGHSFYMLENYKRAKKYFSDSLVSSGDTTGRCKYWIGCCWMGDMDWGNAIQAFEEALKDKEKVEERCVWHFEAEIKLVECEMYYLVNQDLEHFEEKFQSIINSIHECSEGLSLSQKQNLFTNIYIRLQILYQKHHEDSQRKLIIDLLKQLNFNYSQDNLHERTFIYYSLGMIQKAFVYSYASARRLQIRVEITNCFRKAVNDRKDAMSLLLAKKNSQFKVQFNYLVKNNPYNLPEKKEELSKAMSCNAQLESLLPILKPFYMEDKFQQMVGKVSQIGERIRERMESPAN